MRFFIFSLMFSFVFFQCSQQPLSPPSMHLNPVYNVQSFASNHTIILNFSGNNSLSGFYGYNIYVNTSNAVNDNLEPILGNDTVVSYRTYISDPNTKLTISIKTDSFHSQLTNGKAYYLYVKSVVFYNEKFNYSDPGLMVSSVPETNYIFKLHNLFSGQTNNSLKVYSSYAIGYTNIATNQVADFVFLLKLNNGQYAPYLQSSTNIVLQDIGAYDSLFDCNIVPDSGYTDFSILLLEHHIVAFYNSTLNLYGKLYIESLASSFNSKSDDATIDINVMMNTVNGRRKF